MKSCSLLIAFLFFVASLSTAQTSPPAFVRDSLDAYVNRALDAWGIPGVSVAIVKDGKVVLAKGYGVKELGKADAVDEHTLFMIGSNTKAMTATAIAMLHAQKKLSLDDKVIKWLPEFRLKDPWITKELTIADLLCHRIGMETFQGDFMYWTSLSLHNRFLKNSVSFPPHMDSEVSGDIPMPLFLPRGKSSLKQQEDRGRNF